MRLWRRLLLSWSRRAVSWGLLQLWVRLLTHDQARAGCRGARSHQSFSSAWVTCSSLGLISDTS